MKNIKLNKRVFWVPKNEITFSQPKMTRTQLLDKEKRDGLPGSYLKNIATHNKNNRDFFKRLREKSN